MCGCVGEYVGGQPVLENSLLQTDGGRTFQIPHAKEYLLVFNTSQFSTCACEEIPGSLCRKIKPFTSKNRRVYAMITTCLQVKKHKVH